MRPLGGCRAEDAKVVPLQSEEGKGLVFKAHRLLYHSTLGSRGIDENVRRRAARRRRLSSGHFGRVHADYL